MVSKRSVRNIQFALLIVSTGWGFDYLLPPTESGQILNYIENRSVWPLPIWGGIMVFFGGVGLVCEVFLSKDEIKYRKLWAGSWIAHAIFASVFITLAYGAFVSAPLANEGWAGWRTPVMWGFIAILHTAFARRLDEPVEISDVEFPPKVDLDDDVL